MCHDALETKVSGDMIFFFFKSSHLKDHPRISKWLITMVIVSPLAGVILHPGMILPVGGGFTCFLSLPTTWGNVPISVGFSGT